MSKYLKNDFMKLHALFMTLYLLTFITGWFRSTILFFYWVHVSIAISSFVLPLALYIFSKNKKLIRQMIKSNFKLNGRPVLKLAKISTLIILFYYVFSVISGIVLNNQFYNSTQMYQVFKFIHSLSKTIVPVAVVTHVVTRLMIKSKLRS